MQQGVHLGIKSPTHTQRVAQPHIHTGLIRVPLAPWTSRILTAAPVRGSLPALSDRTRLHRVCPADGLVLSEWNPQMPQGRRRELLGPFLLKAVNMRNTEAPFPLTLQMSAGRRDK